LLLARFLRKSKITKPIRRRATIDAAIIIIGNQLIPFFGGPVAVSVPLPAAPSIVSGAFTPD
jgi:hypothetical protein